MIRQMEELSMNAWPAFQNMLYDGWVLRFADGYTQRANSINPIYSSTRNIDLKTKILECEKIYESRGLDVIFKITPNVFPDSLDHSLNEMGYKACRYTSLRILDLVNLEQHLHEDCGISDSLTEEWLLDFCRLSSIEGKDKQALKKIMLNIVPKHFYVSLLVERKVVACGLGVVEDDFVGLFDIVVDAAYRNKGYGKQLVLTLLKQGKHYGANKAYLQVMLENSPAVNLYNRLGFKELYQYWYRIKE